MQKTVLFLSSAHSPFDDRIFYHFAQELSHHFNIIIITSTTNQKSIQDGIQIDSFDGNDFGKSKKISSFIEKINTYRPDIIFSSEPLPILAAKRYKRKNSLNPLIIYDITEWYPSKKNISGLPFFKKMAKFITLFFFNLYAVGHVNAMIFGEFYKSIPYKIFFPFKKHIYISYYPDLKHISHNTQINNLNENLCLGYTGRISIEKGIGNFFNVARAVEQIRPELKIKLKIIGKILTEKDNSEFQVLMDNHSSLEIELVDFVPFESFTNELKDIDILFDLRKIDFENTRCLPIKLFYYIACGKPIIYSNLKAIKREVDVSQFGYLVDPEDSIKIANLVINYIHDKELYIKHCTLARKFAEEQYNWDMISNKLTDFTLSLLKS